MIDVVVVSFDKKFSDKKNKKSFTKEVRRENPKKEEVKETVKEEKADLSKMTVAELRDLAKTKEIKGYSTMKKAELLEALK